MVTDFKNNFCKNGNIHVEFLEDGKKRRIIFYKDTFAFRDYMNLYDEWGKKDTSGEGIILVITSDLILSFIMKLRKRYRFTVNENNPSVFTPFDNKLHALQKEVKKEVEKELANKNNKSIFKSI